MKTQGRMNTNLIKTMRKSEYFMNSKTSSIITAGTTSHEHDTKNSYVATHGINKSNSVRIMMSYS